jgi:uncharacterized iron-regulated membrane protein
VVQHKNKGGVGSSLVVAVYSGVRQWWPKKGGWQLLDGEEGVGVFFFDENEIIGLGLGFIKEYVTLWSLMFVFFIFYTQNFCHQLYFIKTSP